MNKYDELSQTDLVEIEDLATRVTKRIGRRKFVKAASALAFVIPASSVITVSPEALAVGSAPPMMGGGMMGGGMMGGGMMGGGGR